MRHLVLLTSVLFTACQACLEPHGGLSFRHDARLPDRIEAIVSLLTLRSEQLHPAIDTEYSNVKGLRALVNCMSADHRVDDFEYIYGRRMAVYMAQWWSITPARPCKPVSSLISSLTVDRDDSDADGLHHYDVVMKTANEIEQVGLGMGTELGVISFLMRVLCLRGVSIEMVINTITPDTTDSSFDYICLIEREPMILIEKIKHACFVFNDRDSLWSKIARKIYAQLKFQNTFALILVDYQDQVLQLEEILADNENLTVERVLQLPLKVLDGDILVHFIVDKIVMQVWGHFKHPGDDDEMSIAAKLDLILHVN